MKSKLLIGLAAAASFAFAAQAHADSGGVRVGVLTCHVSSGWGLVFGSSKELNCTFSPTPDRVENYSGKINKYGVDIGYQKGGIMAWAVFAPTASLAPGSLAGGYGGVTAGASAGVGASANALVGGSNKTISLQPLSVEGTTGLNIAAGVGAIELVYNP
jgi:hypothetical protein